MRMCEVITVDIEGDHADAAALDQLSSSFRSAIVELIDTWRIDHPGVEADIVVRSDMLVDLREGGEY